MRSIATRSALAATLCTGVAMVGTSVHGLVEVDAELERSVRAAKLERAPDRSRLTVFTRERGWDDCPARDPRV
jgi:hypothetical protein